MTAGPTRARMPTAAQQLALDLPVSLPAIAIEPEWKAQQRLWGHSFHPMCSYLASFPAALRAAFEPIEETSPVCSTRFGKRA